MSGHIFFYLWENSKEKFEVVTSGGVPAKFQTSKENPRLAGLQYVMLVLQWPSENNFNGCRSTSTIHLDYEPLAMSLILIIRFFQMNWLWHPYCLPLFRLSFWMSQTLHDCLCVCLLCFCLFLHVFWPEFLHSHSNLHPPSQKNEWLKPVGDINDVGRPQWAQTAFFFSLTFCTLQQTSQREDGL